MENVENIIQKDNYISNLCTCGLKDRLGCKSKSEISLKRYCIINLVQYTDVFLQYSWIWLNDVEIKRLTNTPDFTRNDQNTWFQTIKYKPEYKIWGIDYENIHIGVCGLKNITDKDCEYWGYIGEKDYWGRGIGSCILHGLVSYARKLNLKSIWLVVLKENQRAINLYSKFGFKNEFILKNGLIKMRLIL